MRAFPEQFRLGNTWSMIVFGLDITEFEYAYRRDGPYDPARGLLFAKEKFLLDPYARAVTGQSRWGVRPAPASSYHARAARSRDGRASLSGHTGRRALRPAGWPE